MPWKIISLFRARQRLVQAALARRQPLRILCRAFGVSRPTAYKWLRRYRARGQGGLHNLSRRPRRSPRQIAPRWRAAITRARQGRPHWGGKKIYHHLRRQYPRARLPCARTIQRWLRRLGQVAPARRRARRGPQVARPMLTPATRPNQVWTVDFKGWFRTADGVRQEPLTVRDLRSRYVLCVRLLPSQDDPGVRRVFQHLFGQRGLPRIIRVDNGAPFGGKGALGLSRLSVWWLRLGLRVEFMRPARPGDNAGHEQFHGCYQREVVAPGGPGRRVMQQRTGRWVAQYNQHRPHEALGQRLPAEIYRPSPRPYSKTPSPLTYARGWAVRRVRHHGHIKWQGRLRFIGRAFVKQSVGLQPLSRGVQAVYLGRLLIGHLHEHDPTGMRPARWARHPIKLKM